MTVWKYEIEKIILRPPVIIALLLLICLNGALLIYDSKPKEFADYSAREYRELYDEFEGATTEKTYIFLANRYQAILKAQQLLYLNGQIDLPEEDSPDEMAEALFMKYSSGEENVYKDLKLYGDVLAEITAVREYDRYLSKIENTAEKVIVMKRVYDPKSYFVKNIKKTRADFSDMKTIVPEIGPSKGISIATGFTATNVIIIFIVFLITVLLTTREKELGQLLLTKSALKGRYTHAAAKYGAIVTISTVTTLVLYLENVLIGAKLYGVGRLGRPIQSVSDFISCNWKMSVGQYLVAFVATKLLICGALCGLFFMIASIIRNPLVIYGISIGVIGSQLILYMTILSTSWLSPLKYLNIFAFLNTKEMISTYRNVNLLGIPVSYKMLFFMLAPFLWVICLIQGILFYGGRKEVKRQRTGRFGRRCLVGRHTILWGHEIYKVFYGGRVVVCLIAFAVIIGFNYQPVFEGIYSTEELFYKNYRMQFQGRIDEAKIADIDYEQERLDAEMQQCMEDGLEYRRQILQAKQTAYSMLQNYVEYLKSTDNGEIVYGNGFRLLTHAKEARKKDISLALLASAMVVLCTAYICAVEYQTGIHVIIRATKKGKWHLGICKIMLGIVIVTTIFLITYVPHYYNVLHAYGQAGIYAPACSLEHLANVKGSILGYMIRINIVRWVLLNLETGLVFLISKKTKSLISTIAASAMLIVLPLIIMVV